MTVFIHVFLKFILFFLLFGCESTFLNAPNLFDRFYFSRFGTTFISNYPEISLKELHLQNSLLIGKKVILEAKVDSVGDHNTHFILDDSNARILIVQTDIDISKGVSSKDLNKTIKILGDVGTSKMGMVYINLNSIKF